MTEKIDRVKVTIAGVTREVGLWHLKFPNGGGWSFFLCPACGRRARVLRLCERLACRRCTVFEGRPLRWRSQLRDNGPRIERLRQKLYGEPVRLKPKRGGLDRRWRLEQALRKALIAERRHLKGARDALAAKGPNDTGKLR